MRFLLPLAGILLVAFGMVRLGVAMLRPERAAWQVALTPSYATEQEFLRGERAPDALLAFVDTLAPDADVGPSDATPLLAWSDPLENRWIARAHAHPTRELVGERFVISLDLERESSVVLLAFASGGEATRLFPTGSDDAAASRARLPVGGHVLPAKRMTLAPAGDGSMALAYQPGFARPDASSELALVLARRDQPLRADEFNAIDPWLGKSAAEAADGLESLGFEPLALTVRSP